MTVFTDDLDHQPRCQSHPFLVLTLAVTFSQLEFNNSKEILRVLFAPLSLIKRIINSGSITLNQFISV